MQVLSLNTEKGMLLIPLSMVVQVVRRTKDHAEANTLPHHLSFIRYSLRWQEYDIPLIFSSEMLGASVGADDAFLRAVVLSPMKDCQKTDLFALTCLDSPKVIALDNQPATVPVAGSDEYQQDDTKYVLGSLRCAENLAFIPNLKRLSEYVFPADSLIPNDHNHG